MQKGNIVHLNPSSCWTTLPFSVGEEARIREESFSPQSPSLFQALSEQKDAPSSHLSQGCTSVCEGSVQSFLCCFSFFPTSTTPAMSPSHVRLMLTLSHKCLWSGKCFQFNLIFSVRIPGRSLWLGQRLFHCTLIKLPETLYNSCQCPRLLSCRYKEIKLFFHINLKRHRKTPIFAFWTSRKSTKMLRDDFQ